MHPYPWVYSLLCIGRASDQSDANVASVARLFLEL